MLSQQRTTACSAYQHKLGRPISPPAHVPGLRGHRYLHIMKGEKSPRLSGQVLPGYSLLITSRYLA
ncbi:hypothetical protein EXD76_05205, partial [BEV proteobacterium]|nr:hypothetical protein [Candidatus Symbiopectobacterium sp. Chty_BC]